MLILGEKDILAAASLDDNLTAVEESFKIYDQQRYFMPHRTHVDYKGKNLLYMPCSVDDRLLGTKYLTIFPENIRKGVPSLNGLMVLNDFETGKPLCVMNGMVLTAMRTGAVGGTGIRHTSPENVDSVGLVGTGVQGFYQLRYAAHVRKLKKINLYSLPGSNIEDFAAKLGKVIPGGIKMEICTSAAAVLEKSQVIITATTATEPVFPNDPELLRGKHYIAIGSYKPTMRELPGALMGVLDHLFIDAAIAGEESGDLSQPLAEGLLVPERIRLFSDYLLHDQDQTAVKQSTTLFKSVGMGIFDLVVADII